MIAAGLVDRQWSVLQDEIAFVIDVVSPSQADEALRSQFRPILDVLESRVFAFPETNEAIDLFFTERSLPPLLGVELIEMATRLYAPEVIKQLGLEPIVERCGGALEEALAAPERQEGDWSIPVHLRCTCELCVALAQFLADPERQEWLWPLAKQRRRHIHGILDQYELPVTHETIRSGSPQKLELIKTRALFKQERERRAAYATALRNVAKYRRRFQ